ncbi:hypothetical protein AGRHK599_LOCUS1287 [Rhizobium rhizogenes]|uniref:Uncharacterized protein n=1 Tax=Rhizobium rhizogenes TaxID=359 RepID=A0AAN2A3K0_RHIRH|nr:MULTISPECIES: hypothetical protein [Rhizobium/Agrobacterium group]MCZ7443058.1 hypothetical protein [Rhizobium rhizogenes]NSZ79044.1 hypothetical protein [Agrobacterium tumefaciens]OAM65838.1 hypothetical protein A8L48_22885 [Rhizobium rhizogenes]CAD0211260.1 hypothetical protein AGRHK599_LOCUS1287 [Rhizobium rhizogenes]
MVIDFPLPHWRPDAADINNPGLKSANNCTPSMGNANGTVTYLPMLSSALYASSSLDSQARGLMTGTDSLGIAYIYTGTTNRLSRFNASTQNWVNVSRAGGYATTEKETWKSIQYASSVIATNYSDNLQYINMDNLDPFSDLTSLVRARHITEHRGFVILGNTQDEFDGQQPSRVRWSALNNPFDWTFSQATQADYQDLRNVGSITGIVSDEDVWVFCTNAIVRMHYIGTPWIFNFSTVIDGRGCTIPTSMITVNGKTFYYAGDGWYVFEKGQNTPIGAGKVDRYFSESADTDKFHLMTVVADRYEPLIIWTYVSKSTPDGQADRSLIFNYLTGEWSTSDARSPMLFQSVTTPWTIDSLAAYGSIDNVPASFDADNWAGGNSVIWGLDVSGKVYTMTGPVMTATIETAELQIAASLQDAKTDRAQIQAVRPVYQSTGTATVTIGSKQIPNDDLSWSNPVPTTNATGYAYLRNQARYHSIRCTISGNWNKISSFQVDAITTGGR